MLDTNTSLNNGEADLLEDSLDDNLEGIATDLSKEDIQAVEEELKTFNEAFMTLKFEEDTNNKKEESNKAEVDSKLDVKHTEDLEINVKKLVYISHPSSGLEENTKDIEKIIRRLYKEDDIFNEYCFVSPVHNYGFMYHDTEYHRGLSYCTDLLYFCDEMWVFGNWKASTGCKAEVELASKLGIKTRFLGYSSDLDKVITNKSYKIDSYINTPSQKREIKRNKTVFLYIESKVLDRITYQGLSKYIKNKILYKNMDDAYLKVSKKAKDEKYILIEVEMDGNSIMDLDDSYTALKLSRFTGESKTVEETEKNIIEFALANNKKALKRIVKGDRKISLGCDLTTNNKEIYKILDTSCIKDIKVYDTYIINDSEQIRAFTFVKSFN